MLLVPLDQGTQGNKGRKGISLGAMNFWKVGTFSGSPGSLASESICMNVMHNGFLVITKEAFYLNCFIFIYNYTFWNIYQIKIWKAWKNIFSCFLFLVWHCLKYVCVTKYMNDFHMSFFSHQSPFSRESVQGGFQILHILFGRDPWSGRCLAYICTGIISDRIPSVQQFEIHIRSELP